MSSFETGRGRRKLHNEAVKSALAAGWPALVLGLATLAVFFWQISMEPEGVHTYGVAAFGLSRDALAEGRWWTLLTHILIQDHFVGQVLSVGILGFIAWKAAGGEESDPKPLGWRFLALFSFSSLLAAVVHLVTAPRDAVLTGVWPGLLGLLAYLWCVSRPGKAKQAAAEPRELKGMGDERSRRLIAGVGLALFLSAQTVVLLGVLEDWPWSIEVSWPLRLSLGALAGLAGFTVAALGLKRTAVVILQGLMLVWGVAAVLYLLRRFTEAEWQADMASYPLGALVAGLAIGLGYGLGRHAAGARSDGVTPPRRQ